MKLTCCCEASIEVDPRRSPDSTEARALSAWQKLHTGCAKAWQKVTGATQSAEQTPEVVQGHPDASEAQKDAGRCESRMPGRANLRCTLARGHTEPWYHYTPQGIWAP